MWCKEIALMRPTRTPLSSKSLQKKTDLGNLGGEILI